MRCARCHPHWLSRAHVTDDKRIGDQPDVFDDRGTAGAGTDITVAKYPHRVDAGQAPCGKAGGDHERIQHTDFLPKFLLAVRAVRLASSPLGAITNTDPS
jgi:hypothetical protein